MHRRVDLLVLFVVVGEGGFLYLFLFKSLDYTFTKYSLENVYANAILKKANTKTKLKINQTFDKIVANRDNSSIFGIIDFF